MHNIYWKGAKLNITTSKLLFFKISSKNKQILEKRWASAYPRPRVTTPQERIEEGWN